jgi:hypothetical protein
LVDSSINRLLQWWRVAAFASARFFLLLSAKQAFTCAAQPLAEIALTIFLRAKNASRLK